MKDKFLCLLAQFDKETQERLTGYYDIKKFGSCIYYLGRKNAHALEN